MHKSTDCFLLQLKIYNTENDVLLLKSGAVVTSLLLYNTMLTKTKFSAHYQCEFTKIIHILTFKISAVYFQEILSTNIKLKLQLINVGHLVLGHVILFKHKFPESKFEVSQKELVQQTFVFTCQTYFIHIKYSMS